jgi:hypothetical protein
MARIKIKSYFGEDKAMKTNMNMKHLLPKFDLKKAIKPFLPKYEVVCTNYQLIPGLPVNKNLSRHTFDRGEIVAAKEFYTKVVSSEMTRTMAPVEVQLRKIYIGTTTLEKAEFGPVNDFKKPKKGSRK